MPHKSTELSCRNCFSPGNKLNNQGEGCPMFDGCRLSCLMESYDLFAHKDEENWPENQWRGSVGGIVDAPVDKVWYIVSKTDWLTEWMPMVETCTHLKGVEGQPGYVRLVSGFMFPHDDGDRSWIKERLVSMDPLLHKFSYKMEATNVGLDGSLNSLKLIDYGDDSTLVDWSFEISPVEGASEESLIDYLGFLYKSCINKISGAIKASS
ncbi:lachrymatory-factor synthase-like [Rutidosis leptorrhynchoides]|uniref:lachrymatory-factor synthase-like n=1 Tax=Rutidosis leptorrhynchoides TaxID=125765 RepID=UPI003A9A0F26